MHVEAYIIYGFGCEKYSEWYKKPERGDFGVKNEEDTEDHRESLKTTNCKLLSVSLTVRSVNISQEKWIVTLLPLQHVSKPWEAF